MATAKGACMLAYTPLAENRRIIGLGWTIIIDPTQGRFAVFIWFQMVYCAIGQLKFKTLNATMAISKQMH